MRQLKEEKSWTQQKTTMTRSTKRTNSMTQPKIDAREHILSWSLGVLGDLRRSGMTDPDPQSSRTGDLLPATPIRTKQHKQQVLPLMWSFYVFYSCSWHFEPASFVFLVVSVKWLSEAFTNHEQGYFSNELCPSLNFTGWQPAHHIWRHAVLSKPLLKGRQKPLFLWQRWAKTSWWISRKILFSFLEHFLYSMRPHEHPMASKVR